MPLSGRLLTGLRLYILTCLVLQQLRTDGRNYGPFSAALWKKKIGYPYNSVQCPIYSQRRLNERAVAAYVCVMRSFQQQQFDGTYIKHEVYRRGGVSGTGIPILRGFPRLPRAAFRRRRRGAAGATTNIIQLNPRTSQNIANFFFIIPYPEIFFVSKGSLDEWIKCGIQVIQLCFSNFVFVTLTRIPVQYFVSTGTILGFVRTRFIAFS